jgi:alpha-tubulin suppressor-like RCC1 family protein
MAARVQSAVPVMKIAAGCQADQSYFLTADGRLWGMGFGEVSSFSDIGLELPPDEYFLNRPEPILVTNVTAMSAGNGFNYMLVADGSVWGVGSAPGAGEQTNIDSGSVAPLPMSDVTAVAVGDFFGLFLRADGSLWGVGDDGFGQLGDGTNYSDGPSVHERRSKSSAAV